MIEKSASAAKTYMIWIVAGVIIILATAALVSTLKPSAASPKKQAGQIAVITASGPLAVDETAYKELSTFESAGNKDAISRMLENRRLFWLLENDNVTIVTLGRDASLVELNNGPTAGRRGWISNKMMK